MVLEKDGEDRLDRTCKKLSSVQSQGGKGHHTYREKAEVYLAFRGSCIVNVFQNTTKKLQRYTVFYFCKLFHDIGR